MAFSKTVIVLKELENGFAINGKKITGIARIELVDGVSEIYLSTINLNAVCGGAFYLIVTDCKKLVHVFDLGLKPYLHGRVFSTQPSIDKGFSAGLCFVKEDLPITIAFGATENSPVTLSEFKRLVADTCYNLRRKAQKEKEELAQKDRLLDHALLSTQQKVENDCYDDEAVATENFYALEDNLTDKLNKIKENDHALLWNEDAISFSHNQEKTKKSTAENYRSKDETNDFNGNEFSEQNPYYLTVKDQLEQVFYKFAPEKKLCALFADSRWAKVNYSKDKFYVVGVVKECGKEKYICYGVPEKYSPEPPSALKGCATFIPLSVFELKGDGYWMMFQDAVTGECIKLKKTK